MKKNISKIAKYMEVAASSEKIDVVLNDHNFLDILSNPHIECPKYNPDYVPALKKILNDDAKPRKIVMGPYGSGKTSGIINAIMRDAVLMPICDDGIRKCKVAFVRNTSGQLETTTLNTWLFWAQKLPSPHRNKKPQLIYSYRFRDKFGPVHLDILFLALDRDADISKLDSLEISHVYFNELRHIPQRIFDTVQSRIGRYPSKTEFYNQFSEEFEDFDEETREKLFRKWSPYEPKLYADTNAPKNRHWIAELEKKKFKKIKIYHQPPALLKNDKNEYVINPKADNLACAGMGESYYLDMVDRGEEFLKVYALGLYGTVVDGKSVYPLYNDDFHSIDDIPISLNSNIYVGCDYGIVCPAVLIAQFVDGQIKFIQEFIGEYESIKDLWKAQIMPFLNMYCRGLLVEVIGDPADTGGGRAQLAELGVMAFPAKTNKVDIRISSVSSSLNELVRGKPRIVVSKAGCHCLREGFLGEYHYRRLRIIGDEKYVDYPEKTHPYSDIHDAAQYIVMRILDEEGIKYWEEDYRHYSDRNIERNKTMNWY